MESNKIKNLFESSNINNITINNRFIRSAICEKLADEEGHIGESYYDYYDRISKGNVGLIITGYTTIFPYDKPSQNMTGIYDDSFIEEQKKVAYIIHENGGRVLSQIVLGKEYINEKSGFESYDFTDEFTKEDIKNIIDAFVDGAVRMKKAGFDGVQLHCAHGYFLSRTLSPIYNKRKDEYGKHRYKLIKEVYEGVRKAVGKEFIVAMKINCEDKEKEGASFKECYETCIELDALGIDLIEISGGTFGDIKYKNKEAIYKEAAEKIAKDVKCPIALVGLNRTLENMKYILNTTDIEYVSLARPFICEINLINRWIKGQQSRSKCISCGQCYTDEKGNQCILNK